MMNDDENPDDILQTLPIYTTCQAEEAANYAIGDAKRTLNSRQAEAKETGGHLTKMQSLVVCHVSEQPPKLLLAEIGVK